MCLAQLLVERAERFVHQHKLGLEDQGTGQRDALLLATGQLRRTPTGEIAPICTMSSARLTFIVAFRLAAGPELPAERTRFSPTVMCGNRA